MKPLCIDLFCGLGGWSEGFLAEGWTCIGFDIERHDYGSGGYSGQLVLQDVLTLHGSQFRHADVIVASPPCQEFSYMAMPWSRAKQIKRALRGEDEFPTPYSGSRTIPELTALFDACFRIQREACEATHRRCPRCFDSTYERNDCSMCYGAGYLWRDIPLIVENVKGAQEWVGRSRFAYGSFHLWGNIPALMPQPGRVRKSKHKPLCETPEGTGSTSWFFGNSKHEGRHYGFGVDDSDGSKNSGGSWFAIANNTGSGKKRNPVHSYELEGVKQNGSGPIWFDTGIAKHSSRSDSRKAASAQIAKIPFALSSHLARVYKAERLEVAS